MRIGAAVLLVSSSAAWAAQTEVSQPPQNGSASVYERSVALVRSVLAQRPGDARVLSVLAETHFRRGKFKDAIVAYGDVLRSDPHSLDSVLAMAESYMHLEDYDHALDSYRKLFDCAVLQLALRARRGAAEVHFKCGRYSEAAAEVRAGIQSGDDGAEQRFLLGRALEVQARGLHAASSSKEDAVKMDAEAEAALARAVQMDPGHAQAYYILATIHRRHGEIARALSDMESFRRARQTTAAVDSAAAAKADQLFEARTAVQLARALFTAGDAQGAQGLIAHALKIQPGFDEALAYQAWILAKTGKIDEAARIYESLLAAEPDHAEALWNLGKIQLAAGRTQDAAPLLLRATQVRKSFPEGWETLSMLAQEHGIYADRAEEFARNALKARPSAANHARLAVALLSSGKGEECRHVLQEGLKRFPGDPDLEQAAQAVRQAGAPGK